TARAISWPCSLATTANSAPPLATTWSPSTTGSGPGTIRCERRLRSARGIEIVRSFERDDVERGGAGGVQVDPAWRLPAVPLRGEDVHDEVAGPLDRGAGDDRQRDAGARAGERPLDGQLSGLQGLAPEPARAVAAGVGADRRRIERGVPQAQAHRVAFSRQHGRGQRRQPEQVAGEDAVAAADQ